MAFIDFGPSLQGALSASLSSDANGDVVIVTANVGVLPTGRLREDTGLSGVTGIANSPKTLVVGVTATAPPPIPSVLVANPASIVVTRQVGAGGSQTFRPVLVSTGSTQIPDVNIDLTASRIPPFLMSSGSGLPFFSYTCGMLLRPWETPCDVLVTVPNTASLSVGTYTALFFFRSGTGQTATISLTINIVP